MRLKAKITLQRISIRKGHRHITGLHGHQFLVSLKVIPERSTVFHGDREIPKIALSVDHHPMQLVRPS